MYNAEKDKNIKSFDEISKEAGKLKDDSVAYMKSKPSDAVDEVKDKAKEAGKDVADFFKRNSAKLKDTSDKACSTIKENPLTSAAAIFATGLIVGSIFNRSRKA